MAPAQTVGSEPRLPSPNPATPREQDEVMVGGMSKKNSRQRLLRGLKRMSSSPSLSQPGRARSASSPSNLSATFSCLSLASTPSPFSQSGSDSSLSFNHSTGCSTAQTSTPGTPSPCHREAEDLLAVRKVDVRGKAVTATVAEIPFKKPAVNIWAKMPHEIKIYAFSFLRPRELVRVSRVSRDFHRTCFDGQLWTSLDASEFYKEIPVDSLAKIIISAGSFVKDLNLRGCVQVDDHKRAEALVMACKNLINATLEGCKNLPKPTLHALLKGNTDLAYLNLTGLTAVSNTTCKIIARNCHQLEALNVSWCKNMDARGIKSVAEGCLKLKDLRAGEIKGFDNRDVAMALFRTNNLERLVLAGCEDLTDMSLRTMVHGTDPEIDILTNRPVAPPRRLRHLDLSRCNRLTTYGVRALGHLVPDLEGLQLTGIPGLTDAALEPILASTPRLTLLELEDLDELTNSILSEHLAKAPCAPHLEHLSVSYCRKIGDAGMLPVLRSCAALRNVDMDNTRITDLTLAEAATAVRDRASRARATAPRPPIGLNLVVYDCSGVTWTGVREVLSRNAEGAPAAAAGREVIGLKCHYLWQMTVDEHTRRVLRGDLRAARRLERKWAGYMQANEEAGAAGAGARRRRRRARAAQQAHADEEETGAGRRRARTTACVVM